jgi:Xaa-Pro aminopeptidase
MDAADRTSPAGHGVSASSVPALPASPVSERLPRLRAELDGAGCDALLVTHLTNIRYLTGFTGSAALLLVLPDETVFVSDGRYGDQASEQLGSAGVEASIAITNTEQRARLTDAVAGIARLGLEADAVTWTSQRRYADEWFDGIELVPTTGLVERLRVVKDPGEIARIEVAAAIADAALAEVWTRLLDGPTERELALELDWAMRRGGADDVSFETICASGPNGAKPHARPGSRQLGEGDLVVLDFGALVDGYHSDMTRSVCLGDPTPTQARMLEVVLAAQEAGVAAVAAGVDCRAVDAACREVIGAAGWGDAFLHGTGHGVGLDIHEDPRVARTSEAVLVAGTVVTVEPGVYLPEHGGVRIEDTLLVTAEGCRRLTAFPKTTTVS